MYPRGYKATIPPQTRRGLLARDVLAHDVVENGADGGVDAPAVLAHDVVENGADGGVDAPAVLAHDVVENGADGGVDAPANTMQHFGRGQSALGRRRRQGLALRFRPEQIEQIRRGHPGQVRVSGKRHRRLSF
jgi:hypothetical protein